MRAIRITTSNEYLAHNLAHEFGLKVETIIFRSWWRKTRYSVVFTYPSDNHWRTDWAVCKFRLRVCRLALAASWAVAGFTEEFIDNYKG